jgi:hypothetical protein
MFTWPLRNISDFLSFFIAYTWPVVFSLQVLTCPGSKFYINHKLIAQKQLALLVVPIKT